MSEPGKICSVSRSCIKDFIKSINPVTKLEIKSLPVNLGGAVSFCEPNQRSQDSVCLVLLSWVAPVTRTSTRAGIRRPGPAVSICFLTSPLASLELRLLTFLMNWSKWLSSRVLPVNSKWCDTLSPVCF